MKAVCRLTDTCTGHGCWPSRPNSTASPSVHVDNLPVHRQSDSWETHCCGPLCHDSFLSSGSGSVYVENKQIGRVTDPIACGSTVQTGSETVFAGD